MTSDLFIGYVGEADFHDGKILQITHQDRTACVTIKGASDREYIIEFSDVEQINMEHPINMIIYAISEVRTDPPFRRFHFTNWDDKDSASLEIVAKGFLVKATV